MIKKIALIIELFLIVLYTGAVLALPNATLNSIIPYFSSIATVFVISSIMFAVVSVIHDPTVVVPNIWIWAITLTTFLIEEPRLSMHFPALCMLSIMVVAFLGKRNHWIIAQLFFIFGVPLKIVVLSVMYGLQIVVKTAIPPSFYDPWFYIYGISIGIFSTIYATSVRQKLQRDRSVVHPDQTSPKEQTQNNTIQSERSIREFVIDRIGPELDELLSSVVYFMSRNFKAYSSLGFLYDNTRKIFILNSFYSKSLSIKRNISIILGDGVIGKVGVSLKPFMSGSLAVYNMELKYYGEEERINSILVVPIISGNILLGALALDSKDTHAFKDADKDTLKRFASLAAALIRSERMRFEYERTAQITQLFYLASHKLTQTLKTEEIFNILFSVIPGVISCSRQIGIEFDWTKKCGRILSVFGTSNMDEFSPGMEFSINTKGLYSYVFQKRQELVIGDFRQYNNRYFRFFPDEVPRNNIRSLAIFPLMDSEQRCGGLFSVETGEPDQFTDEIKQVFMTLVKNVSVAYFRATLYQKMERLATIDGLTGLNNHRTFQEILGKEIERSERYNRSVSLLLMDIDHFKSFNDTYGHPVGDLVLKEIAACIQRSIRINDVSARYGGEEFVVIIPESEDQHALKTAERIRSTIELYTIFSLNRKLKVTVSIGCSVYPKNATSQQMLIDTADKALYAAKNGGRNRVVRYMAEM